MKKFLLISLLSFLFIGVNAQSWMYHPFPTDSAMWRENSGDWPCTCCNDYQLTIDGDTVVTGVTYHKLKWHGVTHTFPNTAASGVYYDSWGCGSNPSWEYLSHHLWTNYPGAFREDVPAKKVYYLVPGESVDTLLYNFNLAVGDTLPETYNNFSTAVNVINSIDSVVVGSAYHKRFNIAEAGSTLVYVSLIEGVGSTFGLYGQLMPPFETQNILKCFWSKGLLAYPMGTTTGCAPLTVGINEKEDLSQKISLHPNPTYGKFQVSVSDTDTNYSEIEITDVLGKITYHTVIKNKITELDLSDKTAGVYFVRFTDSKGNNIVKKIIKE